MQQSFNGDSVNFRQNSDFLDRPRLKKLLSEAMDYPLVAVYAGAGYGKTHMLHSFLHDYNAYVIWKQVTERDNITTSFWESYVHLISLLWSESAARILEIGFPEADETFAKYSAMVKEAAALPKKQIMVYDDFHLLHNPVILRHIERTVNVVQPNSTIVILSRTEPNINLVGLMMANNVFTLRENVLCFTEDEIAEYFSQLGLSVTKYNIRDIYDDTQGWAFAVSMIGRSLVNEEKKYERYALEAMKKNIFRLIETEITQTVSEPLWRFLLRISLVNRLSASLLESLAALANNNTLIKEMEQLNAYIRYDFNADTYMIHPLFLEYLRQEKYANILTHSEKRETYELAGQWCENNDCQADALSYYEKAGSYDAIMRIIYSFNVHMSQDMAKYASEIFDRIPQDAASQNPLFPAMHLKLKIRLGMLEESSALAEQYVKEYEARPESPEKNHALSEIYHFWAILRMLICTYTDVYDFDVYFEKQRIYYDKNPYEPYVPFIKQPIGVYTLLIGTNRAGAPEQYIAALSSSIPKQPHVLQCNLYGFDDLARGELNYYRRELNYAEQHFKQALYKASLYENYDIKNRATLYLMFISFSRGDIKTADALLQSLKEQLENKDYADRYEIYDMALGHYYLTIHQPEKIPDWLKSDIPTHTHPAFLENNANRIKAQYHYATKQYNVLLAFLENVLNRQILITRAIVFIVLKSLSLYHLKRRDEAISSLTEAYNFAYPNKFITPFTQFGKDMHALTAATLKDDTCTIPKTWLEDINRKTATFAKRQRHIISEYMNANNIYNEIILTNREAEILSDLSQGLSRTEIASSQNISINTVKMMINILYDKLHATSLADAIRIATNRGLLPRSR